jgi:hypothetical protein
LSELDNQIAMLKSRRDAAQLAKARAEATRETAQASSDAAMAKLKEEFGVDNLDEARAKLTELQEGLRTQIVEITSILDTIE